MYTFHFISSLVRLQLGVIVCVLLLRCLILYDTVARNTYCTLGTSPMSEGLESLDAQSHISKVYSNACKVAAGQLNHNLLFLNTFDMLVTFINLEKSFPASKQFYCRPFDEPQKTQSTLHQSRSSILSDYRFICPLAHNLRILCPKISLTINTRLGGVGVGGGGGSRHFIAPDVGDKFTHVA